MRQSKTELKHKIQDSILHHAESVWYALGDGLLDVECDDEQVREEIDRQLNRVRKLFGLDPKHEA